MAKKKNTNLIKTGSPHPNYPTYKLVGSYRKIREANKAEHDLYDNDPKVIATRRIHIQEQHAICEKKSYKP